MRKFGPGGRSTATLPAPGATDVRGSAQIHDDEFKACVALQAQFIFDTFGWDHRLKPPPHLGSVTKCRRHTLA